MDPYTILTNLAQKAHNRGAKKCHIFQCREKHTQKPRHDFRCYKWHFEAILWQQLPIAQLSAALTVSLLDYSFYVPCFAILHCVA